MGEANGGLFFTSGIATANFRTTPGNWVLAGGDSIVPLSCKEVFDCDMLSIDHKSFIIVI